MKKPLRLQDFDFIREICQGSFATVVLGHRQTPCLGSSSYHSNINKEPYAVKVFQKSRVDELNMHHHIIRELSVMAYTNQYPHLFPQLYGCFLSQSYYNIVMEYIPVSLM
jgi:serine/threonine protein kinase